jgi:UDP-N-acetylmuramoyl-tripeptide--D-alanyl-D-alanine ligase
MMFTLTQAHAWLPGSTLVGDGAIALERVHSDTRTLRRGDLFVAIRGERFDANDFLADAQGKGALAAIGHRGRIPAGMRAWRWTTASWRLASSPPHGARGSSCR